MMDEKEKKDIAGDADACADCTAGDTEDKKSAGCAKDAKDAKDKKEHSGSEAKKHKSRIAELERELEEEKKKSAEAGDKYLRTLAEYDNFRRRSKEERDAMYADAVGESVRELLPIIDNLKRASQYTDSEKLSEGVAMILISVPAALEKLGVEEFGKVGEKFDPNLHNAVLHEESAEFGESEIMDVLQTGYRRGDKILRFAMVKVAN